MQVRVVVMPSQAELDEHQAARDRGEEVPDTWQPSYVMCEVISAEMSSEPKAIARGREYVKLRRDETVETKLLTLNRPDSYMTNDIWSGPGPTVPMTDAIWVRITQIHPTDARTLRRQFRPR